MRTSTFAVALLGTVVSLTVGVSIIVGSSVLGVAHKQEIARPPLASVAGTGRHVSSAIAAHPDRGSLVRYAARGHKASFQRGAYTWYPVDLSEEHALHAATRGVMLLDAPDGRQIRLNFDRLVEHANGNWTWIGRPQGAKSGVEAIITFGERAVFGSIPNGDDQPLELTTMGGRSWLIEVDDSKFAPRILSAPDFIIPGEVQHAASVKESIPASAASAPEIAAAGPASTIVDVLIGYTQGFATRLGGSSQAETRLQFLVDVTNQAYLNSQVDAQINLVRTVQVAYPDATSNRTALMELTGVNCTSVPGSGQRALPDRNVDCTAATRPAALEPLITAREQYGADLVALVRMFQQPENQSCGTGWLLGGGQRVIDGNDAAYAMSVVADSSGAQFPEDGDTCRHETLAHQLGHNMGLQHDRGTAQGTDDSNNDGNPLDPDEYGRFAYSFGYRTGESAGNFHDIMAIPGANQVSYRVFSNPNVTLCGNRACGVADSADNARTLRQTMPVVATFRTSVVPPAPRRGVPSDINADGRSDILWYYGSQVAYWVMNGGVVQSSVYAGDATPGFSLMTTGDFNGDGAGDFVFSNGSTLRFLINNGSGTGFGQFGQQAGGAWLPFSASDINNDGRSDLVWRYGSQVSYWVMNGATIQSSVYAGDASPGFRAMCVADFNGDGAGDFVFSNGSQLRIWINNGTGTGFSSFTYPAGGAWEPFTAGDVNGDGKGDLIWRYGSQVGYWIMDGGAMVASVYAGDATPGFRVVTLSDFTGDGAGDFVFSNGSTLKIWINNGDGTAFTETTQPAGGAWQLFDPNIVQ